MPTTDAFANKENSASPACFVLLVLLPLERERVNAKVKRMCAIATVFFFVNLQAVQVRSGCFVAEQLCTACLHTMQAASFFEFRMHSLDP